MALVTDAQVKAIIDTARDTTPFIDTADLIINEEFVGSSLSVGRLTQIELYLAAHFVAITEERGGLKMEKMGDATDEMDTDMFSAGFGSTRYGQQALALDSSGTLKSLSSPGLTAKFRLVPEPRNPARLGGRYGGM